MNGIALCGLLLLVLRGEKSHAFSGAGAATSNYSNTDSTSGLCTSDNKDEPYYQQGLCQSLAEELNSGCTKEKVDDVCKQMAGKKKDSEGHFLPAISPPIGECTSKDHTKSFSDIVKDPTQCVYFLMNYMAMTVIKESNWDVLKGEDAGSKGPGGLLNLNLDGEKMTDMENSDYACGCKDQVRTTSGQTDVSFSGQSPGPLDGHHSLVCGETMAIAKIAKEGFGGGNKNDPPTQDSSGKKRDPRTGLAALFASHQDRAQNSTSNYGESSEEKNDTWYKKKTAALCKYMFSTTNPWQRELTTDVTLPDRPKGSSDDDSGARQ